MGDDGNYKETIISYWTRNLVESSSAFTFNISVSFLAGVLYTFRIIQSPSLLFLFGIISPIIFTICLYDLLLRSNGEVMGQPLPKVFNKANRNRIVMIFDCSLIILFAALIYFNILNYFLFRFLQTLFFPLLLLIMLKGFYFVINQR
ncbi:MAG: hypothetical protein AB7S48_11500 [Bacteroidales bacterium]